MFFFILNCLFWIILLYFIFRITYKLVQKHYLQNQKLEDTYLIIATKNSEKTIESLVRSVLYTDTFRTENIILVDLNSTDDTNEILRKINEKSEQIKIMNWKEVEKFLNK